MLENREGQRVFRVTFRTRRDHEWVDVTTDEEFNLETAVDRFEWLASDCFADGY